MSVEEKKNRRVGILTSLGIHVSLFLIFFFLMAWRAPNPPLPDYGIELNFGLDDQGTGDVQPETPVGNNTEAVTENLEQAADAQPEETQPDIKEEVKDIPEKNTEDATSKVESPVVVKEEKKEVKTETKKEKTAESSPKEKVVAEYKKEDKKEVAVKDASKKGDAGSQGDDTNKIGDKGSPEGKLDAKALYGTPGGGGGGNGFGLAMSGWKWADDPKIPELPDNENGRVVFEIECDESGEITRIDTKERSLSLRAEQILKDEIRRNSLERTAGGRAPERSTGKIIFILKTK